MKFLARLEKSHSFWFLIIASLIFYLLRLPSLFEPYWYADEGIYQAVGMLIKSGEPLYSGAWENKPPLLLVFYAFLNSDQFLIRCVSLVFGLISVWIFYLLSKRLFINSFKIPVFITLIYVFIFGTTIIEGNIANAENFILLPILLGAYLILSSEIIKKTHHFITFFSAGLLLSFAFLIKIVAVFDFFAFSFFILADPRKNLKDKIFKNVLPFSLGFVIPIIATIAYFFISRNFKDFMDAFLLGNIGYVGIENEFIIPQGFLFLKTGILSVFLLFIYWKRKKINKNIIFITIWFAFALFNTFFSQRPYTHYLIMLLPSFCLMIGAVFYFSKERIYLLLFLTIGIIAVNQTFFQKPLNSKFIKYYSNFIEFSFNKKSLYAYQSFFDKRTPRDYEIANYIKLNTNKNDDVFIWGNNAQVYKLTNKTPIVRYTVAYHITFFPLGISDMRRAINTKNPKLIIIMPNDIKYPLPLTNYTEKTSINGAKVYEKIF